MPDNFQIINKMTSFEWTSIEPGTGAARPGPRWGHSCCVVNENLYLFGGFANSNYMNDLWVYNLKNLCWKEVVTLGDVPEPRSNATLNYDTTNHQLILFGGGGPNKQRFNSISILDLNNFYWVQFPPFQNEPSPWERTYHTAEYKFPYLVVFGGEGIDDLGDLWVYNMETLSWKQIKFTSNAVRPKSRRFHSSCMIDSSIYVFGGCQGKYSCLNDLFKLDLTSFLETESINDLKWQQIKLNGDEISARWGQTSHHYNGQIYVFGGRGAEDLQDTFSINPKTGKVRQIKTLSPPQPRRRHSGGFVGGCLVLFGGFDGNYFNDLFYINLYKNKYQKDDEKESLQVLPYHDYDVFSYNKLKVSINTALIGKYFETYDDMLEFLNAINNFYLFEELQVTFQTLYTGYGKFPIQKVHKSMMKFFPKEVYPTKQEMFQEIDLDYGYSKKLIENDGKAIQLQSYQLASYVRHIQQHWQNNRYIKLNNFQVIKFNKELLSSSSIFFDVLLSKNFKNEECTPIYLKSCSGMHLALIFAFLHSKFLVIPKCSSYQFLVEMAQLAEYFTISSLLKACEEELSLRVTNINCKELSEISIELGMDYLSEQCSLLTVNELMIGGMKNKVRLLPESDQKMLDAKTLQLYKQIQFDLAHQKTEGKYARYSKNTLKVEEKTALSNKENTPANGLPRKTSNHFQK